MAFTKAPEYNTHQMEFVPVGGDPKMYPLVIDAGVDHVFNNALVQVNGQSISMVPIPPIVPDNTLADDIDTNYVSGTPIVRSAYQPALFGVASAGSRTSAPIPVVIQDDLWLYTPGSGAILQAAAQYTQSTGSVGWTEYNVYPTRRFISNEVLTASANTNTLRFYDESYVLQDTVTLDLGDYGLPDIVSLDGYLFAIGGINGQRIFNSDIADPTTWNTGTDFIDVESNSDPLVGLIKHHNHLVAFGTNTIEFFYNAANEVGSPLQRQASYAVSIGAYYDQDSRPTKCTIGDVTFFSAAINGNFAGIYKLEKFKVEKVSPDWLDVVLNRGLEPAALEGRTGLSPLVRPCKFGTKYGILVGCGPLNNDNIRETYFLDIGTGVWSYLGDSQFLYNCFTVISNYGTLFFNQNYTVSDAGRSPVHICNDDFYNDLGEFEVPPGYTEVTSSWKTPGLNMKTFNDKHFYSIEVLGSFPYNTVTLYVEEDNMRTESVNKMILSSKTQTKKEVHQNPLIWRNIGRFRNPRFTVEVTGKNNYRLDGLVIKFNQGTK